MLQNEERISNARAIIARDRAGVGRITEAEREDYSKEFDYIIDPGSEKEWTASIERKLGKANDEAL